MYLSPNSQDLFRNAATGAAAEDPADDMAHPMTEDIQTFQAITQCVSNDIAARFIQGAGNNLNAAIEHYYDNPNRYDQPTLSYDEAAFSHDRYGEPTDSDATPAFQIHAPDEPAAAYSRSAAPTRPPSRTSQKSLAVSQQETGLVGSSGTYFGPATRDDYDLSKWAMTATSTVAAEIHPDLEVMQRIRSEGEPVFMKPLTKSDPLPAFITILGSIPQAVETILSADHSLQDYGEDPNWWSGTPIALPQTIDEQDTSRNSDSDREIIWETQRLMAFMQGSERMYGSVEALDKLKALEETTSDNIELRNQTDRFLVAWSRAAGSMSKDKDVAELFLSRAITGGNTEIPFHHFDIPLEYNPNGTPRSLYDAVDDCIWESDPDGGHDTEAYLLHVPPVLVMRLVQPDVSATDLQLQVPPTWYLDRYMKKNSEASKKMRQEAASWRRQYALLEEVKKNFQFGKHPTLDRPYETLSLIDGTIQALGSMSTEDGNNSRHSDPATNHSELVEQLKSLYDKVELKLRALEREKQAALAKLDDISSFMKEPSGNNDGDDGNPKHRYTLRGVSSNYRITYVLSPDGDSGQMQWWKMEYQPTPWITRERVSEEEVLKAASEEGREALLVFASDEAARPRDIMVPGPLQAFVERDNLAFSLEQQREADANSRWGAASHEMEEDIHPPIYQESGDVWEADAGQEDVQNMNVTYDKQGTEMTYWDEERTDTQSETKHIENVGDGWNHPG